METRASSFETTWSGPVRILRRRWSRCQEAAEKTDRLRAPTPCSVPTRRRLSLRWRAISPLASIRGINKTRSGKEEATLSTARWNHVACRKWGVLEDVFRVRRLRSARSVYVFHFACWSTIIKQRTPWIVTGHKLFILWRSLRRLRRFWPCCFEPTFTSSVLNFPNDDTNPF